MTAKAGEPRDSKGRTKAEHESLSAGFAKLMAGLGVTTLGGKLSRPFEPVKPHVFGPPSPEEQAEFEAIDLSAIDEDCAAYDRAKRKAQRKARKAGAK